TSWGQFKVAPLVFSADPPPLFLRSASHLIGLPRQFHRKVAQRASGQVTPSLSCCASGYTGRHERQDDFQH
ncbi:hypothetical protein, partial [Serratia sp. BW106]|uniref:hypothetical protein n=1 Tax=Serratia sp. BW106 TaxID=1884636 RepID=UPI001E4835C4